MAVKLTVNNASFGYKSGESVIKNLSFEVGGGDLLAILGPNGAGKTTLLRCIMGFLRWREGESLLDGKNLRDIPSAELWRNVAYVPQAKSAASSYTAFETVLLGRTPHIGIFSLPSAGDEAIVRSVMERLGISRLADKRCSEMSGGEFQMVLIAKALASEPKALILDEPESNLDFRNQLIVLDTLTSLAAGGMLCVFNTHYPAHALGRANKSLILGRGGGCIFGETGRVVTEENIAGMFGVRAVVGELETPQRSIRTVAALSVIDNPPDYTPRMSEKNAARTIAVVSVISHDDHSAEKINALLHEYRDYLVGRMGMPYRSAGVNIINITLDAPEYVVSEFDAKLRMLNGISVKTTYAEAGLKG